DGDVDGDGAVSGIDLGLLLGAWDSTTTPEFDLDGDGTVGAADIGILLSAWGPCDVEPTFLQVLPTGLSPEGVHVIPQRNLLVVSSEVDSRADLVRATVSIYQLGDEPAYPS